MVNAYLGPDHDLAKRLTAIEAAVAALQTQPVLQSASNFQSDGTPGYTIGNSNGTTRQIVYYGPGTPATSPTDGFWPRFMYIGQLLSGGVLDGVGLVTQRPDGSVSMTVGNQGVGIVDPNGHIMVSENTVTKFGLQNPVIPYPTPVNTNVSTWFSTTNTSPTTVGTTFGLVQHSVVSMYAIGYAPTGVTGKFQLYLNTVASGSSWTATNNAFATSQQSITLPSPTWQGFMQIDIDAQVTAGAGTVSCLVYLVYGIGS